MTSPRPALIVAMHDGFYGHGTGAGRSNRDFLRVLCDLLAPTVQLTVMPIRLAPGSAEYDPAWYRETLSLLNHAGGHVTPVDNGTSGRTRFGGLGNFRQASASAAARITPILDSAPQALVVAFDAPFFGLAPLLPARHAARIVNVARATAALHAPGDHHRVTWERDGLLATAHAGGRIAATSRHIRHHLADAYGIPPAAITDLINGLVRSEAAPCTGHDGDSLLPPAASRGFLLSYGRAEPYKGFHDLLDALVILRQASIPVPHLILGAVTDGPPLTEYQRNLARRIEADNLDATLHTSFSPHFRELLAHPGLCAVIVPSRAEPFGRIPLEAYQAGASPVVATTAGGLTEIVTEGTTGYTADPGTPPSLAAAITRALTTSPEGRRQLLSQGRHLTATSFDYRTNTAAFLASAAPWATGNDQST
jgi:glycosyltransferase involved in cell wall biosynthesis